MAPRTRQVVRLPAFVRLDAAIGWRLSPKSTDVRIEPSTGELELGSVGDRLSPLTEAGGSFGGLTLPTGVAVAPDGTVLVADPEHRVILRNPHPGLFGPEAGAVPGFAPLWPAAPVVGPGGEPGVAACALPTVPARPGPYDLVRPRGLAFSRDGDLLVADEGRDDVPGRLIVLTWPELFVRRVVTIDGRPWDVAVDGRGRIHVADVAAGRVRRLTRGWVDDGWPGGAGALNQPRHLAVATDEDGGDIVHVVDLAPGTGRDRLSRLTPLGAAEELTEDELTAFWQVVLPPPIQRREGALFAPGDPCPEHGPRLRGATVDRRGRLPQGPLLVHVAPAGRRARTGTYYSETLDSGTFAFAWHRLVLDMDLGTACAVGVRTVTLPQPLEPGRVAALPEQVWSTRILLTPERRPEVLIQSPPGRHLAVALTLIGDGAQSPRIRAVDVLGPRRSSLRFLPRPFHDDPVSRDFLDRFLSYFDTVFAEVEHRITRFPAQLTPQGAPEGAFLAWLAGWFDIEILASWSDATRRAFLAEAMALHRTRGTVAGLRAAIRLHLGLTAPMPALIEGFRVRSYAQRRAVGTADLPDGVLRIAGVPLTGPTVPGDTAHRFVVVVPAARVPTAESRDALRRLVDLFRPAHTDWQLIAVGPGVRVGCQSTVGVDTLIGTYPDEPLGEMRLGRSAALAGRPNLLARLGDARLGGVPLRQGSLRKGTGHV